MPGGRPTKYKKEYCIELVKHMAEGLSFESFWAIPKISIDTAYKWADKHIEFAEAKKIGEKLSLKYWENMGREIALGDRKGNPAVWIFTMKNRFGWTDKQEISASEALKDLVLKYKI